MDNRRVTRAGQGARSVNAEGYAMAALLVGLSVMAVLMSALMPVWSQMARREREAELIFRGEQYARAIGLFQRKYANTAPPTIDLLVEQRFLRKKYKDPITNDEFQPVYANQAIQAPGQGAGIGAARPGQVAGGAQGAGGVAPGAAGTTGPAQPGASARPATAGGLVGVTSKSKATSIRLYNGRSKYNEWIFVYVRAAQQPGATGGAVPGLGGRPGGPGQGGPGARAGQPGAGGQPSPFGAPSPFGPSQGQGARPFGGPASPGGGARPPR